MKKEVGGLIDNGRFLIGPFSFLTYFLFASEILLWRWMSISDSSSSDERIVAGAYFLVVLIAILVVCCVVYWIKRKYDSIIEEPKFHQRFLIGPFLFLAVSLTSSEILLLDWMSMSHFSSDDGERIIAGAIFISVIIAVLVIFCIIYWIKRKTDDVSLNQNAEKKSRQE